MALVDAHVGIDVELPHPDVLDEIAYPTHHLLTDLISDGGKEIARGRNPPGAAPLTRRGIRNDRYIPVDGQR